MKIRQHLNTAITCLIIGAASIGLGCLIGWSIFHAPRPTPACCRCC